MRILDATDTRAMRRLLTPPARADRAFERRVRAIVDGVRTGGDRRNRDFAEVQVEIGADKAAVTLAFDPQTAGGLLVSVPAERAALLEATLTADGIVAARVGRIEAGSGISFL